MKLYTNGLPAWCCNTSPWSCSLLQKLSFRGKFEGEKINASTFTKTILQAYDVAVSLMFCVYYLHTQLAIYFCIAVVKFPKAHRSLYSCGFYLKRLNQNIQAAIHVIVIFWSAHNGYFSQLCPQTLRRMHDYCSANLFILSDMKSHAAELDNDAIWVCPTSLCIKALYMTPNLQNIHISQLIFC